MLKNIRKKKQEEENMEGKCLSLKVNTSEDK
jgi:hypothetical protein